MTLKIDNRYTILKTLGSGLSGEVLQVEDEAGPAALKLLKRVQLNVSPEEALAGFKSEFEILKELNHPGIGRILDFGYERTRQKYYFTTELIEGRDFYAATEAKPFEVVEDLAVQILRALNYLHSRGIYHFDLKPQNVLVKEKDGKMIAKIIDFGLAGFSSPRKKVGTPAYMAPEVILGGNLDNRTDLYSFGVMLYKVLTRTNPFASKSLQETLSRQKSFVPEPPSRVNPAVPKFWDDILPRLLEKNPADRYTDAAGVIRDIAFISGHHYDIETQDTRLSYLPEKGALIGREKAIETFKEAFSKVFEKNDDLANRLLVVAGAKGTGKSRLLSEFKYISQLRNVPVYSWANRNNPEIAPPFCIQVDADAGADPDEINAYVQEKTGSQILVIWVTEEAPAGRAHCDYIETHPFTMEELQAYLATVTGQKNPPPLLIREIYSRTSGNPLFVSELLHTMLANNMLLDASGRWASTTFEDIGINFNAINVPATLSEMLFQKYAGRDAADREILDWMAVLNRPVDIRDLEHLRTRKKGLAEVLLSMTRDGLIERTNREHHYYFANPLMREAILARLKQPEKWHDRAAAFLNKGNEAAGDEALFHQGYGSKTEPAIAAFEELGKRQNAAAAPKEAYKTLLLALDRARRDGLSVEKLFSLETQVAEYAILSREYKLALVHYQNLAAMQIALTPQEEARLHEKNGDLHVQLDEFKKALLFFEKALELIRKAGGDKVREMVIRNHIGFAQLRLNRHEEAIAIFEETAALWDGFPADQKSLVTNNKLATAYMMKGDLDQALRRISHDLAFFAGIKSHHQVGKLYWLKGEIFLKQFHNAGVTQGKRFKDQALAAFTEGLRLFREEQALDMVIRCYNGIGSTHFYAGDYGNAEEYYRRGLALARQTQDVGVAVGLSINIANIHHMQKNHREAYPYYVYAINAALGITARNAQHWFYLYQCYVEMGEALICLGDLARAKESLDTAEETLKTQPYLKIYEYGLWINRAKLYKALGDQDQIQEALTKAEEAATEPYAREEVRKLKEELGMSTAFHQLAEGERASCFSNDEMFHFEMIWAFARQKQGGLGHHMALGRARSLATHGAAKAEWERLAPSLKPSGQ